MRGDPQRNCNKKKGLTNSKEFNTWPTIIPKPAYQGGPEYYPEGYKEFPNNTGSSIRGRKKSIV